MAVGLSKMEKQQVFAKCMCSNNETSRVRYIRQIQPYVLVTKRYCMKDINLDH